MKPKNRHRSQPRFEPGTILIIKQIALGLSVFAVAGLLVTAVWYATRVQFLTLSEVRVEGGITISHDQVRELVDQKLTGAYLKIIPRRFAYTYPEVELKQALDQINRIKDVSVERTSGTVLEIRFDEYIPDSLWCDKADLTHCLFLDERGYAFGRAPILEGESVLRFITSESDLVEKKYPFSTEDYNQAKQMAGSLSELGWSVSRVEINSTRDTFYTLIDGGEIKTTLTEDQAKPLENLQTILGSEKFSHLKPGNFQYLDLRFGTRVFVNEELPEEVASSTDELILEGETATTTE